MRRKLKILTTGKQYVGEVDMPLDNLRSTDLFNSANLYWKDPAQKSFNDAILLHDVTLSITGKENFQQFKKIQIRQPDIICFSDDISEIRNEVEAKRADTYRQISEEEKRKILIITKMRGPSFFMIGGSFYGLFKSKSTHKYIPISDAVIFEIIRKGEGWEKNQIELTNNFVAINTTYIESCSFDV